MMRVSASCAHCCDRCSTAVENPMALMSSTCTSFTSSSVRLTFPRATSMSLLSRARTSRTSFWSPVSGTFNSSTTDSDCASA